MVKLLLLVAATAVSSPALAQDMQGQQSQVRAPRTAVARTAAAWQKLWAEHAGEKSAAPEIDFSREMVVAVFFGERMTAGAKPRLTVMEDPMDSTQVFALYRLDSGVRAAAAQVVSAPFAMAKVSRDYAQVHFEADGAVSVPEKETAPKGRDPRKVKAYLQTMEVSLRSLP
jgi:hypothetical protein